MTSPLYSVNFRKRLRGSRSTAGASGTRSTYGSAAEASRTSSRPPPPRASPSIVVNVDEENDDSNNNGDAAEAQVTSTSAHRCRSVASAPARPSRSLTPFPAQPNYSQSAYSGTSKGKGDNPSSKGGKGASNHLQGVSSGGTFAGIAPSGRIIMSGGRTGLGVLKRALANWPILEST